VLCVKSELHLNQDGLKTGEGIVTLPVRDLFTQIITETGAGVVFTVGTAVSVFDEFQLGDVVVTRAAKFRCRTSSATRPSTTPPTTAAGRSDQPAGHGAAVDGRLHRPAGEPPFGPPHPGFTPAGPLLAPPVNDPDIKLEQGEREMPEFHAILTTDYVDYDTTTNRLGPAVGYYTAYGPQPSARWPPGASPSPSCGPCRANGPS
jgi:hypothetical protein